MPPITVVIADQDKRRRAHFLHILQPEKGKGISVVGVARSGLEAMMASAKLRPRILLLNLNLIKRNRNNLLPTLRQNSPRTKVILLTRHGAEAAILEGLSHGAWGYLNEGGINTFLPKAVRLVDAGEAWVPRKMVAKIVERQASLMANEEGKPYWT